MMTKQQFRVAYQALRAAGPDATYRKLPAVVCCYLRRVERAKHLGDRLERRQASVAQWGPVPWVYRELLNEATSWHDVEADRAVAGRVRRIIDERGGLPGRDHRELTDTEVIGIPPEGSAWAYHCHIERQIRIGILLGRVLGRFGVLVEIRRQE